MEHRALLVILDGWGYSPDRDHNAIALAHTPVWDRLWQEAPRTLLETSGEAVGLPSGQMGNSEVGHLMIGAGRVVLQDLSRIDCAIDSGEFQSNQALNAAISAARKGKLHVMGLLSPGGVHSHQRHFRAFIDMLHEGRIPYALHAFLDGRDTSPRSALSTLREFDHLTGTHGIGRIASIAGRFYAMDRDERWDRIAPAHQLISVGQAKHHAHSASKALENAYARNETDEFVTPTRVGAPLPLTNRDSVVFMNFRADRARQLSRTLLGLQASPLSPLPDSIPRLFVPMTPYATDINAGTPQTKVKIAFAPVSVSNGLGAYWASLGHPQERIAESEKTAHVTFFFNGGSDERHAGEVHHIVPSPQVRTYDLMPEMNAQGITQTVIAALKKPGPRLIVCNFANGDMVGHTGNLSAAIQAVEAIDGCIKRIEREVAAHDFHCLITADHGNVECMQDESGKPQTAHTTGPVPLLYIGNELSVELASRGGLCDVAPTLLDLCGLEIPSEMTGRSLLLRSAGH